ncbi:TPA: hypothetical protein RG680_001824 [Morganella morganii]|uniref:hypothetical protein n=1 Tax=Morganella morganii TaxID=582 RepID=UPI00076B36D8|nr:hypothetical protein [Morganella morganii]EJF7776007.1 hypothetical protein [Salmonella enterica subsp. enterica]AMG69726.1 hypothetical protein AL531_04900 [Morganella morganii]EKQ1116095.1 hypothetical protein [Morganella morganii]EKU4287183.1 hypothetical protein [Morganella morganii]EKU4304546.1 hypothetical protein [Morganella morganii]
MNWKEAVIAAVLIVAAWWVYDTYRDNQQLKVNNTTLSGQLSAQQVINTTTLSAVAIRHSAALDNIKAKQVEDIEHVNVKTVIKTVFKDSECAVAPVPADAVSELRRYATGINTRTGDIDSTTTDR